VRFAGLGTAEQISDKLLKEFELPPPPPAPKVKAGDFVQWTPGGVLQFPEPRRVNGLSESGDYVMVDGSSTGLPINEVTVVQPVDTKIEPPPGSVTVAAAPPDIKVAIPSVRQDIWNLDEGPVTLSYPAKMSAASYEDFESWIQLQLRKIKRGIEQ
jgi:hypothetical protein